MLTRSARLSTPKLLTSLLGSLPVMASVPFLDLPAEIPWHIAPHLTHKEGAMMTVVAIGAGPWRQTQRCPKIASTRSQQLTDMCEDHDEIAHLHDHSHRLAVDLLQCKCCFRWICDLCFEDTGGWCPGEKRTNSKHCEDRNPLCNYCSDPGSDNIGLCENCVYDTITIDGVYIPDNEWGLSI